MIDALVSLPLWAHFALTAVAAAGVWRGGARLALHGDALAERTGWSRAFVGMLLLAGMTELPELVTTVTAAPRAATRPWRRTTSSAASPCRRRS